MFRWCVKLLFKLYYDIVHMLLKYVLSTIGVLLKINMTHNNLLGTSVVRQ